MIEIRDSRIEDVPELLKKIRPEDLREAINLGVDPEKNLYSAYAHSLYCKTFFINDVVSAMSGVSGNLFGNVGYPFLVTTTEIYRISPLKFTRIYLEQLNIFKTLFPYLENHVDASYKGAVKLLKIAGFSLEGPELMGPNKKPFYKFTMGVV
jgi:hypothetical protein